MGTGYSKPTGNDDINEGVNYIQHLPLDIVRYMASYLPNRNLAAFAQTSHRHHEIIRPLMKERLLRSFRNTTLKGHTHLVYSVAITPDGNIIRTRALKGHTYSVYSVAITPDGKTIVLGNDDGTIGIWDLATGNCIRTLTGHTKVYQPLASTDVRSVAIFGNILVSGSWDRTIKIWNLHTGVCINTLKGHTEFVESVAIFGNFIVSGCDSSFIVSGNVKIWDIESGLCIRTLHGHTGGLSGRVYSVAISGNTIVSGSRDRTIKIWDLESGLCIRTLHGHTGGVYSVAISSDGNTIVSAGSDGIVQIWRPA